MFDKPVGLIIAEVFLVTFFIVAVPAVTIGTYSWISGLVELMGSTNDFDLVFGTLVALLLLVINIAMYTIIYQCLIAYETPSEYHERRRRRFFSSTFEDYGVEK